MIHKSVNGCNLLRYIMFIDFVIKVNLIGKINVIGIQIVKMRHEKKLVIIGWLL